MGIAARDVMVTLRDGDDLETAMRRFKRLLLADVLRDCRGNQCLAADRLHIHRNTVARACEETGVDPKGYVPRRRSPVRSIAEVAARMGVV